MSIDQTVSQISQLPVEDQLKIVHAIWDQIGHSNSLQLTPEQRKVLDQRMERLRENPESAMTESELRQKLKDRRERL